jgi:TolB-like protein
VLPFINMNGDPAHEYLTDVITDQLAKGAALDIPSARGTVEHLQ